MNKLYYYELSCKQIEEIKKAKKDVTLLLHACCAPCSCFPLEWLDDVFDITIMYNNSNIYPLKEYEIRLNELVKYIEALNINRKKPIKLIVPEYDNEAYTRALAPYRSICKEGQEGCFKCYEMRLEEGYKYAYENHYDYYGTVMSISRQKNAIKLNEIGEALEKKYPTTKFLYADFKKKGGQDRRDYLSKDMYKQQYCGCVFSYMEYQKKENTKDSR